MTTMTTMTTMMTMAMMVSIKCNVPTVLLAFKSKHAEIQARAERKNKTKGTKEEQQKQTNPENNPINTENMSNEVLPRRSMGAQR